MATRRRSCPRRCSRLERWARGAWGGWGAARAELQPARVSITQLPRHVSECSPGLGWHRGADCARASARRPGILQDTQPTRKTQAPSNAVGSCVPPLRARCARSSKPESGIDDQGLIMRLLASWSLHVSYSLQKSPNLRCIQEPLKECQAQLLTQMPRLVRTCDEPIAPPIESAALASPCPARGQASIS